MPSGNQQLNFAIRAVNEASKALADIQADIDKLGGGMVKAEGHASKFGGALKSVGSIASGFVVGQGLMKAPGALFDMAKAAAEDEKATARLQTTIKSLGGDFDAQLGKVNAAITAGGKLAFTDDEVRDSFQFLAQATGDTDEALKRQAAAMDLARGANIPLATATKMLGKMNEENTQVLKKMGIEMKEGATEAEALAAVQAKFGGQADAYAKSTAGQFEVMKIKIAEAKESIGMALLPIMVAVGAVLSEKVIPAIEAFAAAVGPKMETAFSVAKEVFGFLQEHGESVQIALAVLGTTILVGLIPAFIAWIAATWTNVTAHIALAAAMVVAYAPLFAVALAIGLLVGAVILVVKHWDEITEKVPLLKTVLEGVTNFVTETVVPVLTAIWERGLKPVIDFVMDHWQLIGTLLSGPFMPIVLLATDAFGIRSALVGAFQAVLDFVLDHWQLIATIISGPFLLVVALATDLFGIRSAILGALGEVWDRLSGWGGDVLTFFQDLPGKLKSGFGDGFDFIWQAFRGAINSMINAWNSLEFDMPSVNTHIPGVGTVGGFSIGTPDIPTLGGGGVVMRPTLALIGEAGPEAVIPLSRAGGAMGLTLHIHGNIYGVDDLVREIDRSLKRQGGTGLVP